MPCFCSVAERVPWQPLVSVLFDSTFSRPSALISVFSLLHWRRTSRITPVLDWCGLACWFGAPFFQEIHDGRRPASCWVAWWPRWLVWTPLPIYPPGWRGWLCSFLAASSPLSAIPNLHPCDRSPYIPSWITLVLSFSCSSFAYSSWVWVCKLWTRSCDCKSNTNSFSI